MRSTGAGDRLDQGLCTDPRSVKVSLPVAYKAEKRPNESDLWRIGNIPAELGRDSTLPTTEDLAA